MLCQPSLSLSLFVRARETYHIVFLDTHPEIIWLVCLLFPLTPLPLKTSLFYILTCSHSSSSSIMLGMPVLHRKLSSCYGTSQNTLDKMYIHQDMIDKARIKVTSFTMSSVNCGGRVDKHHFLRTLMRERAGGSRVRSKSTERRTNHFTIQHNHEPVQGLASPEN